ncbi:MAG TPA: 23S rRNA (guanosine(2251)-2'-O)-methyltransferase RlmB [Anaeromyxobacter sp.]|nr:23S rRNA (guanosine(2251)-2'-O)-methyltransferase RlmB [Anaeromyxobacter sp.]
MRVVYGMNPVRELLRAEGDGPSELWLAEGGTRGAAFAALEREARARGARVRTAPRAQLDKLAGTDRHQGVVATVADFRYAEVPDLLARADAAGAAPLVLVLDGVEDPHNLGAIIRSVHALGGHGVVIPKDRAVGVTPVVAKTSAGAVERCSIARVVNVAKAVEKLKESGVWSVALAQDAERPLSSLDLRGPTALVLGSEGTGLRPLVRRTCDFEAKIPMPGELESLSVSAAAAIAMYEVSRQRGARPVGREGEFRPSESPVDKTR